MNKFRKLKAKEIVCRKSRVNAGGVQCLLYAGKFAVPDILDETYGMNGWSVESAGDRNVSLSIFTEDGRKITRLGTCDADSTGKAALSEALTYAGVYFGIGRELYTAPEIFFERKDLKNYNYDQDTREGVCYDMFCVDDIAYSGDRIVSVTVSVINCKDHKTYLTKTFNGGDEAGQIGKGSIPVTGNGIIRLTTSDGNAEKKPAPVNVSAESSETAIVKEEKVSENIPEISKADMSTDVLIPDSEIILVGNCKGKTYGEAKDTETFRSFLKWVKDSGDRKYYQADKAAQYAKFRKLAKAS